MTFVSHGAIGSHSAAARQAMDELNRATAEYLRLQQIEYEIVRDTPSGMPLTDGQCRIIRAGQNLRYAFEKYQRAVKRFCDFVAAGEGGREA